MCMKGRHPQDNLRVLVHPAPEGTFPRRSFLLFGCQARTLGLPPGRSPYKRASALPQLAGGYVLVLAWQLLFFLCQRPSVKLNTYMPHLECDKRSNLQLNLLLNRVR